MYDLHLSPFTDLLCIHVAWRHKKKGCAEESCLSFVLNYKGKLYTEIFLNRAILGNSRKFDHVTPLLRELNWFPVKEQLFYRDSVLTFKCQNDLAPQYLTSKFTKRSNIHTRNTRTRNSLQIPLYRTAIGQRTFSYRGAYTWNNLHNELRQSASLASFKRALKDTLLRQTFPS